MNARSAALILSASLFAACGQSTDDAAQGRASAWGAAGAAAGAAVAGPWAASSADCPHAAPQAEDPSAALATLVEGYFEDNLELNPLGATFIGDNRYNDRLANSIGPEHRAAQKALEERYLAAARGIDTAQLNESDLITRQMFIRAREQQLAGMEYPAHLLPISQIFSMPSLMVQLGSGQSVQPFSTVQDYENFLSRIDGFVVYVDQAIANMREGMETGVVQPKPLMEKVLPQLQSQIVDDPAESMFHGPVKNMPESFSEEDRGRLTDAYTTAIRDQLVPAYTRLYEFISKEYLPACRDTFAIADLPDGQAWYAHQVKMHTTTDLSPDEIHRIGLAEVARIREEMDKVREQVGFEGDLAAFFEHLKTDDQFFFGSQEEVIEAYTQIKSKIDATLPAMFSDFPKADYEIRPVEAFRAQSAAGASYRRPSPDGSRPGVFYVNTYNLKGQPRYGVETLSLHEASPGHHFQISIQQELEDLPRFRRFGGYTAYVEGWALYAEYIGKELGLFTDPYQWYGRLNDEQLRAMRLVVDTGLHSKGWTRQQAIDYMLENSSLAATDVESEVERYIAWPGQALAYKVGQLKLTDLRADAETRLGEEFDIRAWHSHVLRDGAMPLDVLAEKNDRWIEAQRQM